MARKLPWQTNAPTTTTSSTNTNTPRPVKRAKTEHKSSGSDTKCTRLHTAKSEDDSSDLRATRPTKGTYHNGRSPSTSPPPPGPPPIEPMTTGLDGDDVYMMVEDELYDTAKMFTAHLHHAEYKRLVKEARARKQKYDAAGVGIDSVTENVKRRMKRDYLERRQRSGVERLIGSGVGKDVSDGENEDEGGNDEDEVSEPWAGTSLAGLMKFDIGSKVSLKGLERILGDTRAARGLGPASRQGEEEISETSAQVVESSLLAKSVESRGTPGTRPRDTGKNVRAVPFTQPAPVPTTSKLSPGQKPLRNSPHESTATNPTGSTKIRTTTPPPTKKTNAFIDSLDDFDEDFFNQTQARVPSKPRQKREREGREEPQSKPKGDRRDRHDEVPVFLAA